MSVRVSGNLIQIPQGDTGVVKFVFEEGTTAEDRGVFTLAQRGGQAIMRKILEPDLNERVFQMTFVHEDTANLGPGSYEWSLRVVRDGAFDASGKLTGLKSLHTAVLGGRLIVLRIAGGAK